MSWNNLPTKQTNMGWSTDEQWRFTPLSEPLLSAEIDRLAFARSLHDTSAVSFQPCPDPNEANQDRYEIQNWELPNGVWTFRGLFDGHAGAEVAIYTAAKFPGFLKERLVEVVSNDPGFTPTTISDVLSNAIVSFDASLAGPILKAFPDPFALTQMTNEQVRETVNKASISDAISLCWRGTTALVALSDPDKNNLWVASLGDCAAVLGTQTADGTWESKVLSTAHNGENPQEAARVIGEHPGEPEAMLNNRVLGSIAVTRAIGDFPYKLPAPYTTRILMDAARDDRMRAKMEGFMHRNLTPPYVSSVPDVMHISLTALKPQPTFLVLTSDGLVDLSDDRLKLEEVLSKQWAKVLGDKFHESDINLALALLRDGLGGDNTDRVSELLTVEMEGRWMDDTTILVQRLIA